MGRDDDAFAGDLDEIDDHSPICGACGVTALLTDERSATFACENPDCDAFGDPV